MLSPLHADRVGPEAGTFFLYISQHTPLKCHLLPEAGPDSQRQREPRRPYPITSLMYSAFTSGSNNNNNNNNNQHLWDSPSQALRVIPYSRIFFEHHHHPTL